MAVVPPPAHSFTADEQNSFNQPNRYGLSTPRTALQDVAALVTSVQRAVTHQAPKSKPNTQTRRPQCTHTTMNRRHGNHTCHICGKVPDFGFLYSCDQDHLPGLRSKGTDTSTEALPLIPDHGTYFEAQAEIAKSLGMSSSVIRQMRAGEYCYEQIEKLLAQRRHVKEVIRQAEHQFARNTPPSPERLMNQMLTSSPPPETLIASAGMPAVPAAQQVVSNPLPMTPAGTPFNTPTETPAGSPTKTSSKKSKCNFQVCHTCRPFFQDRVPISVDSVLNNEVPAITQAEMSNLPVRDAAIISNMGFRQPPLQMMSLEGADGMTVGGGYDDVVNEDTPTTTGSGWTDALMDELDADDPHPCPGAGICPVFTPSQGCAYDMGFDDGNRAINHSVAPDDFLDHIEEQSTTYPTLHRARRNIAGTPSGTSSTGSSISLPDALRIPLTPITPTDPRIGLGLTGEAWFGKRAGKAATIAGDISDEVKHSRHFRAFGESRNESHSSLGSEVEVEGGVALTEEAVETGMPDIITDGN